MDLGLRERCAVVAAASQGLGQAVAKALAAEGANVVMFSRSQEAIVAAAEQVRAAAADGAEVVAIAADAVRAADLQRVVGAANERFGGVDVLYNNAGGPKPGGFDSLTDDDWQAAFELSLMSAVRLTRLCLPHMRAQRWGRILVGSSSSVKQPIENLMLSNSIRSATTAWVKSLADEVAADGITVNTLMPGRIQTARVEQLDAAAAQRRGLPVAQVRQEAMAQIPAGRYGTPDEFAAAAAFLLSDAAAYITGTILVVDGGKLRATF